MMFRAMLPAAACCAVLAALAACADDGRVMPMLEEPTDPQTIRVPFHETVEVGLPALPARAGKLVALRFGAVAHSPRPAGCNFNMTLRINGAPVGRFTTGGSERLIGRPASFRLQGRATQDFPVFSGPRIMLIYAPDTEAANAETEDGLGGTFLLDVSDIVSGVDGNTLSITNTRPAGADPERLVLVIENLQAGWLDRDAVPAPVVDIPARGPVALSVTRDGLTLAQGSAGGFVVSGEHGPDLLVETGLGMTRDAASALIAQDEAPAEAEAAVTVNPWGEDGFRVEAEWPRVTLSRTLRIRDGLVEWTERWTNRTGEILGLPFRHRVFLRDAAARFTVGGDPDSSALAGSAPNPTLFLQAPGEAQGGYGVTAESDWLRLLMAIRGEAGMGETYSDCLALPPQGSIDFELTITPAREGGYWEFINSVRDRWGVNGVAMERPMFWGYTRAEGETPEEILRRSLGHLGPIYVTSGGWMRLTADAVAARTGAYPKLPADAPRAPGETPDLDIAAFLEFAHRDRWWQSMTDTTAMIRQECPEAKVIHITHPAMEVVYAPLADRFPIAGEVIHTAEGRPFTVHHYNVAHLYGAAERGWAVYYYSPRPGSRYLQSLLADYRWSMDEAGSDGVYCDEFSWAGRTRGYSRYDYSRWDGYSADLDAEGNVTRLKSDNGYTSEASQLQMIGECLTRGKFFLGNGGSALRSVNSLPIHRFIEGGNGHGAMAGGHLSAVPLVLGNFGDQTTAAGVFEAVRQCLSIGCVYSPTAVNLLLSGADNFVCKLYPITVSRLGPGWVEGTERLITTVSGEYRWPGAEGQARLLSYDAEGNLLDGDEVVETSAEAPLAIAVPQGGLVIAEIINPVP